MSKHNIIREKKSLDPDPTKEVPIRFKQVKIYSILQNGKKIIKLDDKASVRINHPSNGIDTVEYKAQIVDDNTSVPEFFIREIENYSRNVSKNDKGNFTTKIIIYVYKNSNLETTETKDNIRYDDMEVEGGGGLFGRVIDYFEDLFKVFFK